MVVEYSEDQFYQSNILISIVQYLYKTWVKTKLVKSNLVKNKFYL